MTTSLQRWCSRLALYASVTCLFVTAMDAAPHLRGQGYILNNGLWPANVIAVALGDDVDVWVTKTGMVYDHHGIVEGKRKGVVSAGTWEGSIPHQLSVAVGNAEATSVTFFKSPRHTGETHSYVATKLVKSFVVKNVYPGVDIDYKMDEGNARFDIVAQRAELASRVKLTFDGLNVVKQLTNGSDGESIAIVDNVIALDTELSHSELSSYVGFKNLKAFQNGKQVSAAFVRTNNSLSFSGDFAPSQPLTIDPTVYGTYLGGPEDDIVADVTVLASGDVAIGGTTTEIDFPAALGAYEAIPKGSSDGFVAVFDAALMTLKRYTYLGGPDPDSVKGITSDALDNIYVAGTTQSPTFPLTGGVAGQIYRGSTDVFALKMNAAMTTLIFSSFIGGNKEDIALDIAIDGDLSVYVCGATNSTANFPTNAGFKKTFGGQVDGFLTKITSSGASYAYSTYFGVEGNEQFNAVVVDNSGSPIVTGYTNSSNYLTFPTPGFGTPNRRPYDRTIEGTSDAFVTKFGQDGGTLIYSTFFGGNGDEDGKGLFVDDLARVYLVGETTSTNLIATAGFKQNRIGGRDVFLFVLSDDGKELVGCTYYGGTGDERVLSVAKSKTTDNAVVVGGVTTSNDLQVEGAGTSAQRRGATDGFIANFTVGALKFADLIGGNGLDTVSSVVVDANDDIYISGVTTSSDFGFSTTAYQRTKSGKIDGFVVKSAKGTIDLSAPTGGESWCVGSASRTVSWAASEMKTTDKYRIDVTTDEGATWIEVAKDITGTQYSWKPTTFTPGNYKLRVSSARGQTSTTATAIRLGPVVAITTHPTPVTVCSGVKAEFTVVASGEELKYKWRKDGTLIPTATSATLTIASATSANAGTYIAEVTGKCGNPAFTTATTLRIETSTTISMQPQGQTVQEGKPLTLSVTSPLTLATFQWKKNGVDIPNATSREYSIPATVLADSGDYSVTVTSGCGSVNSDVATVKVTKTSSVQEAYLSTGRVKLVGEMPVTDVCRVQIDLVDFSEILISVIDVQGATTSVLPIRLLREGGTGFITDIPCSTLPSGSYFLDIRISGQQAFIPFVVSR